MLKKKTINILQAGDSTVNSQDNIFLKLGTSYVSTRLLSVIETPICQEVMDRLLNLAKTTSIPTSLSPLLTYVFSSHGVYVKMEWGDKKRQAKMTNYERI